MSAPPASPRASAGAAGSSDDTTAGLQSQPLAAATGEAYGQVKALFDAVCDMDDGAEVLAVLRERGATAEQAEEVLALWQADASGRTVLGTPVAGMWASAAEAAAPELALGDRLGPWRLVAPLGAGGMGQVFLAQRDDGLYEQRVAVKLLRGWQGPAAQAQLARERRILASLQHPHIAALLDGGSTPAGRPYLVIAHVDGRALDVWCRETGAGFDARLAQFQTVAEAIAYAHRRLVVHCDIKPANVLVDAEGRAMLLDFGIAQLQDRGDDDAPRALTPRYASPEQRAGEPALVASDIYALGRVLEELLSAPEVAHATRARRREWQALVARACAEDPARRYDSVDGLLADLHRLRTHRPLQALRTAGWPYRLRKLLRRQWPWALAGSAALVLASVSVLQLRQERDRALQAQAQAREQAATARQVSDLLAGLFEGADPARSGQPDIPASVLVDRGRERVRSELAAQPAQQAAMLAVLGRVYDNMARYPVAAELYRDAAEIERGLDRPLRAAALLRSQAFALNNSEQSAKAVPPAREALALFDTATAQGRTAGFEGTAGADAMPTRAAMLGALGTVLATGGSVAEAEPLLQQALQLTQQAGDDRESRLQQARALHSLGILYDGQGKIDESVRDFRAALQIKRELLGPGDLSTLSTAQRMARVLARAGHMEEAEAVARDTLARRIAQSGPDSAHAAGAYNELGTVLQDAGRPADAVAAYANAYAIRRVMSGEGSMAVAFNVNNMATAFEEMGSPAAGPLYRASLAIRIEQLPAGDMGIARARHNLGRWLLRQGDPAAAEPLLQAALQARQARLPAGHEDIVSTQLTLAEIALRGGRLEEAAATLQALAPLAPKLSPQRQIALWRLQSLLLQAQGDRAAALVPAEQALSVALQRHPQLASLLPLRVEVAELQWSLGRREAAAATLRALQPLALQQHPASPWPARAQALRVRLPAASVVSTGTNPRF